MSLLGRGGVRGRGGIGGHRRIGRSVIHKNTIFHSSSKHIQESHAIAGRTARCRWKLLYVSKFTVASRSFHCDSTAFELNHSINHGKITGLNIILSIYCIAFKFTVCPINISDRSKCWNCIICKHICLTWQMIDFIVFVLLKIRHFCTYLALKYDTFRIFTQTQVTTFPPKDVHACHAVQLQLSIIGVWARGLGAAAPPPSTQAKPSSATRLF